jgi:hypothetical protein
MPYKYTIGNLINEIERRFHLVQDAEGAELTYLLRQLLDRRARDADRRKKGAPVAGGGGQHEIEEERE